MRIASVVFAAASLLAVFATPTLAADASPAASPVRQACAADFAKFCAGQDPRSETGRTCMRQHHAEFSEGCRTALTARRQERMEHIKTACAADIAKFCNAGSQTGDRPGRCLRDHKAELSESCKAALPDRRG